LFDVAEVLEEFVPPFPEQPRFITATPAKNHESRITGSSINFLTIVPG
jgi:hypothetical protein